MAKKQKIKVSGIRLFAYHGCMDEESRIGTEYEVNLVIWADLNEGAQTDRLSKTVDYVALNKVVKEEMAVRAKLIEVVAERIVRRILQEQELVHRVKVEVSKLAPPIQGDVDRVSVIFDESL